MTRAASARGGVLCGALAIGCATEPPPSATDSAASAEPVWECGVYSPQTVLRSPPGEVSYRSVFSYTSPRLGDGTINFEGLGTAELEGRETWVHRATGSTVDSADTRHDWVTTTWYLCNDLGLQQAHVEETQVRTSPDGVETEAWSTRTFTSFPVVYPPDLEEGREWDYHAAFTEEHSDGTHAEVDEVIVRHADGTVQVSVPAGEFEALHILMTAADGAEAELNTAPGVGTVLTDEMALLSYEEIAP